MELVKKNIISVICGVVAIIAIVASFFPLGGYISTLQGELDKSKSTFGAVDSLRTKNRNQPILKLDETTAQPLGMFPDDQVIKKAGEVVKEVETQSLKMRDAAVKMNKRSQHVPNALPNPVPPYDIRFRDQYVDLVATPTVNNGPTGQPSKLLQKYNAGVLPNPALIEQEKLKRAKEITENRVQKDARGQIINQPELNQLITEANAEVPRQFRDAVAEKSMFYVELAGQGSGGTIDMAPGIAGNVRPRPEAIWWAQVGLWIQQDVLEAVKETNTTKDESGNVPKNLKQAPVKRLTKIQVPFVNAFVTAAGAAPAAPPADPNAAADAPVNRVVQASPTGRVSNGMFDVVHFRIDADVEVDKVPLFIRTISHNRLMSVLRVEMRSVDATQAQLAGYYYGDKPVAQVTLDCEALLLRTWTIPLMPKIIRTQLGIPDPPAPPAPGAPAAAPAPTASATH